MSQEVPSGAETRGEFSEAAAAAGEEGESLETRGARQAQALGSVRGA